MGRFILKTVTNVIYHYILLYAILMAYKRSVGDVMKKQNKKLLLGLAAIMLVSCCIFIFITQGFSGTHRWGGFQYENDKYYNNNAATITKAYYPKNKWLFPLQSVFIKFGLWAVMFQVAHYGVLTEPECLRMIKLSKKS